MLFAFSFEQFSLCLNISVVSKTGCSVKKKMVCVDVYHIYYLFVCNSCDCLCAHLLFVPLFVQAFVSYM